MKKTKQASTQKIPALAVKGYAGIFSHRTITISFTQPISG